MLRALTSYFFGGIEDEAPEAPIECETREVNDWLVVNLPDQNKESINLNDDDDTYEIDDEDIRNDMDEDDTVEVYASDISEMDSDEDDVLLSLSFLMTPMDVEKPSPEFLNAPFNFESRVYKSDPFFEENPFYSIAVPIPSFFRRFYRMGDSGQTVNGGKTTKQILEPVFPSETAIQPYNKICKTADGAFFEMFIPKIIQQRANNQIVNEFEKRDKVHAHVLDLTPPPMHSRNYVNHRHPEKVLNHDLLQRIKELEPEQQAMQRSAKKTFTRGQLNRQNKNYMYETSSKKNRRSNKQRNHSGANNNRKCF